MKTRPEILFIDDEPCVLEGLERSLRGMKTDWNIRFHSCPLAAIKSVRERHADIVISDFRMPGMDGFDIISSVKQLGVDCEFILLTGSSEIETAIRAINQAGVFRFLRKPCATADIVDSIEQAWLRLNARRHYIPDDIIAPFIPNATNPVLELLATAIIIIDGQTQKILYTNQSADGLFQSKGCLHRDTENRCRAVNSELTAVLHQTISQALDPSEGHGFMALPRSDGQRDLSAIVLGLPGTHPGNSPTVAMFINDPESHPQITPSALSTLYGLTLAEANLAHALVQGEPVQEAARTCGITVETARTYLKRIFSKTNVTRQTDLIRLILSTPAYRQVQSS